MGAGASAISLTSLKDDELHAFIRDLSEEQRQRLSTQLRNINETSERRGDGALPSSEVPTEQSKEEQLEAVAESKVEPVAPRESPDDLMDRVLRAGDLQIVRPGWMREKPDDYILQRMQDLESSAFHDPSHAAKILKKSPADGAVMMALSYAWASKAHPDPTGFNFRVLKRFFPAVFEIIGCKADLFGLFMDFLSLPQVGADGKRSESEQAVFKRGLGIINFMYGSPKVLVIQLKGAPEPFEGMNATPYDERGWCRFEETVCGIMKQNRLLMNLTSFQDDLANSSDKFKLDGVKMGQMTAVTPPPLTPSRMVHVLKQCKFTNGADAEPVANLYRKYFEEVTSTAEELCFVNACANPSEQGWGKEASELLAESLPSFNACKSLYLGVSDKFKTFLGRDFGGGHPLSNEGMEVLAPACAKMNQLKRLVVCQSVFGEAGVAALEAALVSTSSPLEELSLPAELEDTQAGQSIISSWKKVGKSPESLVFEAPRVGK